MSVSKKNLVGLVQEALIAGGYEVEEAEGRHPLDLIVRRPEGGRFGVRAYVWNITEGGKNRPANERRIQITGKKDQVLVLHPDIPTVLLGWHEDLEVFARWDATRYAGPMRSQSLQVIEETLVEAKESGVGVYEKSGGSGVAIAFRPALLGEQLDPASDYSDPAPATSPGPNAFEGITDPLAAATEEIDFSTLDLDSAGTEDADEDPGAGTGERGPAAPPKKRRKTPATRLVTERDPTFDDRIHTAYGYRCALSGVGVGVIDAAHIIPVADPASNDETSNGIALSPTYHRAYDSGLITFDAEGVVYLDFQKLRYEIEAGRADGVIALIDPLRVRAQFPHALGEQPHPSYVAYANQARGWDDSEPIRVSAIKDWLGLS